MMVLKHHVQKLMHVAIGLLTLMFILKHLCFDMTTERSRYMDRLYWVANSSSGRTASSIPQVNFFSCVMAWKNKNSDYPTEIAKYT